MRIEMVVSEPFEDFEVIKGNIEEPLWRAWSGIFSVLFISEDGRQFKLPAGVYCKLKIYGEASVRFFSHHHGGLIVAYLRTIPEE
ncbi:hypothetical protein [Thermoflexus hugenholtzii]